MDATDPAPPRWGVLPAAEGPWLAGLQRSIPSDPGIRGPLHPRRLCCPPSPYHGGYASAGRLAGRGASTLSVHDLFRNGPLDAGGLRYQTLATFARSLPFRSPDQQPRSTGRLAEPPASPRVLRLPAPSQRGASWAEQAEGGGRSEVKRSRAGPPHGEPRTEPPPRPRSRSGRPRRGTHVGVHDNGRPNARRMRGGTGCHAR